MPYYPARRVTVIAQDPGVTFGGKILRTQLEIPNEELLPGPRGYRVQVVDYDSSTQTLYKPTPDLPNRSDGPPKDPFEKWSDGRLMASPDFHAMNTYAIIMRTLARFEFALGRRVAWSFPGHQIQVAPHAFADANAFYSPDDQALLFGYFPKLEGKGMVFGCLSHDIVAHETTHALVDGLRERYTDPSSPDQAGFHEGFADIVALLSVFSQSDVVRIAIDSGKSDAPLAAASVTAEALRQSLLSGVAKQFGQELSGIRGQALRRSVELTPGRDYMKEAEFEEPHRRGELLVAAVMNTFLQIWAERLKPYIHDGALDRGRAVEEGAEVADRLLTICIRALDYCPPTDLQFRDFLSAMLTSDFEVYPKDVKYRFRQTLRESFKGYGIHPTSRGVAEPGTWDAPDCTPVTDRTHFEAMQRDPDEAFRYIWENRSPFKLHQNAYTRVLSVRPCIRVANDGFILHETVVEYLQLLKIRASELRRLEIERPPGMPPSQEVTLYGGNAMVFDQYGRLKYNIGNSIFHARRQTRRLDALWRSGYFSQKSPRGLRFAAMHRDRTLAWGKLADAAEMTDWTTEAHR
jgi:hypothetical protein